MSFLLWLFTNTFETIKRARNVFVSFCLFSSGKNLDIGQSHLKSDLGTVALNVFLPWPRVSMAAK